MQQTLIPAPSSENLMSWTVITATEELKLMTIVHCTVILGRLQELEIAEIVIECSESPLLLTTWSISGNN